MGDDELPLYVYRQEAPLINNNITTDEDDARCLLFHCKSVGSGRFN